MLSEMNSNLLIQELFLTQQFHVIRCLSRYFNANFCFLFLNKDKQQLSELEFKKEADLWAEGLTKFQADL